MIGQNDDDDIPPPTGTITTASTLPPPPMEPVQMSPPAATTSATDDDLKLDDGAGDEGDVSQSSVEQVIPLDKLKNGATQAMAGFSWFASTVSQAAVEAKKNLDNNPTYQSSVAGLNAQLDKARQSEVGRVSLCRTNIESAGPA